MKTVGRPLRSSRPDLALTGARADSIPAAPHGYAWVLCSRCSEPVGVIRSGMELPPGAAIGYRCVPCGWRLTFLIGVPTDPK